MSSLSDKEQSVDKQRLIEVAEQTRELGTAMKALVQNPTTDGVDDIVRMSDELTGLIESAKGDWPLFYQLLPVLSESDFATRLAMMKMVAIAIRRAKNAGTSNLKGLGLTEMADDLIAMAGYDDDLLN